MQVQAPSSSPAAEVGHLTFLPALCDPETGADTIAWDMAHTDLEALAALTHKAKLLRLACSWACWDPECCASEKAYHRLCTPTLTPCLGPLMVLATRQRGICEDGHLSRLP